MADNRTYNSRVTTEALEKKFRDTFPSQAGAELVDDLYASGVIVPVVDFTAAAEGSALPQNLQTAVDFATQMETTSGTITSKSIISTPGFWACSIFAAISASTTNGLVQYAIGDGVNTRPFFKFEAIGIGSTDPEPILTRDYVIFLRPGDFVKVTTVQANTRTNIVYRQIATVNGVLVNPLGFTSS